MPLQKHSFIKILILLIVIFSTAQLRSETVRTSLSDSTKLSIFLPSQSSINDSIVNYGKMFLNTPYHYGSQGTDTFDCSGFTSYVYRNFGYNLHRSSEDQAQQFDTVKRDQLKVGDLVFFSGRRRSAKNVGHVGIVVGAKENGEFDFIHAAVHNGVIISNSQEDYYNKRFIKANRVIGGIERQFLAANNRQKNDSTENDGFTQSIISEPTQHIRKIIPAQYHRVKSGETLSSIALKYGLTVNELKRKNDMVGSKLSIKQQLKVKDKETIMMIESVRTLAKTNPEQATKKLIDNKATIDSINSAKATLASNHIVKKGESLFSLSKTYNISTDELIQINNLKSEGIQIGQELKVSKQKDNKLNNEPSQKDVVANFSKTNKSEKSITHKVQAGESLNIIAKIYKISINEIIALNNLSSKTIHAGQELIVEKNTAKEAIEAPIAQKTKTENEDLTHKVMRGENLNSISKEYKISINDLKKLNNLSDNSLQVGQELVVANNTKKEALETPVEPINKKGVKDITHIVKKGENLNSISKIYKITIDDLKTSNSLSSNSIQAGQELLVGNNTIKETVELPITTKTESKNYSHTVKEGESLYLISKKFNVSTTKLKEINKLESDKLHPGQEIILSYSEESTSINKISKNQTKEKPITHVVQHGDSFYSISKKYSCSIDKLKEWNNNFGDKINIGDKITIYSKVN
jgi:LysM repeat protein